MNDFGGAPHKANIKSFGKENFTQLHCAEHFRSIIKRMEFPNK